MLRVDSLRKGIVIDHIKAGLGEKIYHELKLRKKETSVALIMNVCSKRVGKKDIIKIDEHIDIDLEFLGFVDPNITINIIEDGVIKEKINLQLPEVVENIIKCKNPRCITSVEEDLKGIFYLTDREQGTYRCKFCDGEFTPFN